MKKNAPRAVVEVGFILFLFYANLLMGEFTHSGAARGRSVLWAIGDIFTATNFAIGCVAAVIGYGLAEFLRHKL